MKYVDLEEFQRVSGLSSEALIYLIKRNKLHFEYSKSKGLQVEITQINKSDLIQSILKSQNDLLANEKDSIKEGLSRILSDKFEELLDEALADLLK